MGAKELTTAYNNLMRTNTTTVDRRSYEEDVELLYKHALEQEPKTGNWLEGYCSECGCDIPAYIIDWKYQKDMDAKYCPNCGAKMESEVRV